MYMAIREYAAVEGTIEPMVERVSSEFADRIPGQVGAVLYAAIRTGGDTVTTVTVFPDEETARRSLDAVAQVQRSLGDEFGVVEREVIEGPVVVSRASEPILRAVDPR
jgi:hypothetical protein